MSRMYSDFNQQYVDTPMVVYQYGYPGYQYPLLPASHIYPQVQSLQYPSVPTMYPTMYPTMDFGRAYEQTDRRRHRGNSRNRHRHRKNSHSSACSSNSYSSRPNDSDNASEQFSSLDEHNLYVKGLWKDCSQTELDDIFKRFGVIHRSRVWGEGVGFVRFVHRESALKAIEELNGNQADPRCPEPLLVKFAFKKSDETKKFFNNGPEQMEVIMNKNTNNVYIRCLPRGFTQQELQDLCEPFGTLTCMRLRDLGVAFVRYKNPEDAQSAINGLNGKLLKDSSEPLLTKLANSDPFQPKIGFRSNDTSEDESTEPEHKTEPTDLQQKPKEQKPLQLVITKPATTISDYSYCTQPNSLLSVQSHQSAVADSSVPVVRMPQVAPISYVASRPYCSTTQQFPAIPFTVQSATAPSVVASTCSTSSCSTGSNIYPFVSAPSSVASVMSTPNPVIAKQTVSGPAPKVAPRTRIPIMLPISPSRSQSICSVGSTATQSVNEDTQSLIKTEIYTFVKKQNAKWASKVTGMILQDYNNEDAKLQFLLDDTIVLQQKVDEAVVYLESQIQEDIKGATTTDFDTFGTTLSPIGEPNVTPMCQVVYVYPRFQ